MDCFRFSHHSEKNMMAHGGKNYSRSPLVGSRMDFISEHDTIGHVQEMQFWLPARVKEMKTDQKNTRQLACWLWLPGICRELNCFICDRTRVMSLRLLNISFTAAVAFGNVTLVEGSQPETKEEELGKNCFKARVLLQFEIFFVLLLGSGKLAKQPLKMQSI